MKKINLNLYQKEGVSAWQKGSYLLLLAVVALNVFSLIKTQQDIDQKDKLIDDTQHLQKSTISKPNKIDSTEDHSIRPQLKDANSIIQRLNSTWPELFSALEETRESDIDLLSVTPDAQTGKVSIVGQAKNLKALFDYADRLKVKRNFSHVGISDHQKILISGTQKLRFTLSAQWQFSHE